MFLKRVIALLLDGKYRDSGSMEKDGRLVKWDAGFQLVILPLGDSLTQKYMVSQDCVEKIKAQLEGLNWGAVVEVKIKDKKAVDLVLIEDALKDICN